ncbi:MAG: glycosyltransferase family 4 protein [Pseudomonadota bacterium]
MNILFVSSAKHFGGTERWTSMAAAELAGRGHSVWVCCPDLPHAEQFISENRLIRSVPSGLEDTRGKADLAATISKLDINVVIPVSQRMYFLTGQIARRLNIAMVLRLGIVRLPWRPVLDWFGYGIWPDAIIVNTNRIKHVLSWAPFVKPDRIHVIYNGITRDLPVANSDRDERFTISFVGTVSWRKGVWHLISALSHLPDDILRKTRLQIIGTGPALNQCRRLVAKHRLHDNVSFEGHLENPSSRLANSDLFTLLSMQEGISNSLLEAMNAGVASYTTLVGGHGEFIRNGVNAYVASSRNPKAVARDLVAIINDKDRARIARAGQETVEKLFTTVSMGDQLETLLHRVVHTTNLPLTQAMVHRRSDVPG